MVNRHLGVLGETTLKGWCAQVGVVANKSEQDMTGWDHLLEFPLDHNHQSALSIDQQPFPLRCFVQVKSTDGKSGKWSVKLDNWLMLVKNPLPCFFLALEFDEKTECQRAYLIHVDKEYITQVLKRLRKASSEKATDLHKQTMQFKYSEHHRINCLNGIGLSDAIRQYVLVTPEEYATQKRDIVKNVGYEGNSWSINVRFLAPPDSNADPQEILVDFLLGTIPYLDTIRMEITDSRFGITTPEGQQVIEEQGRVEVERKSIGKGTVKIRIPGEQDELRIETEVFAPHGLQIDLPNKYFKVRFAAPFIDFILWPKYSSECRIKFHFPDMRERYELRNLQLISRLIQILHQSKSAQREIEMEMFFNSKLLNTSRTLSTLDVDEGLVQIVETLRHTWLVVQYFDLDQNIMVVPLELMRQRDPLRFLSAVLGRQKSWFRITAWFDSEMDIGHDEQQYCVPLSGGARIGNKVLLVAVALLGRLEPTGIIEEERQQYQLKTDQIELCKQYIFDTEEDIDLTDENLKQIVIDEYKEKVIIIKIDNY